MPMLQRYLNSVCNAVDQWWRSQCFGAGLSYLNEALVDMKTSNYFNFGLIYCNFGGLLPVVEELHQRVLCLAAKMATSTLFAMQ